MKPVWRHRWDLTPAAARQLQQEARGRVILADDAADFFRDRRSPDRHLEFFMPCTLAAVDVGYDKTTDRCAAALVLWDVVNRQSILELTHVQPSTFPYVPGLLSFREIPPLLPLFEQVGRFGPKRHGLKPDLILCDGQGIAHPRRMGLASHLGLIFDCPSLGWAKSRLIGTYAEPSKKRGAATPLMDGDEQIGWVYRSREACRVTFVSPGHRISLARSLELARALTGPCRLAEPARRAHLLTRLAM